MKPQNLLILMSDEHNPKVVGASGDRNVRTPQLDALAARGTCFSAAYTTCPICVPARASFATGKYVHQVGFWDNADAYDGSVPSWHHRLRERGHEVVSIGKLHFRGAPGDDHGFSQEILPMHIVDAVGDVKGLVRDDIPVRKGGDKIARLAGPGESQYTVYDREIAARAQIWLHEAAGRRHERPWVLFVSFVSPHFPLIAPPEWYYEYAGQALPMPKQYAHAERPRHPFLDDYARVVDYDRHFDGTANVQRALAGYYGLVSMIDEHVGNVLRALERGGLAADTRVIYTSDHGDNLGARGLWGKSTFYEESAGVPLIMAGEGIPQDARCEVPASLIDVYPFIFECVGAPLPDDGHAGVSLERLVRQPPANRAVLSEYHATTSVAGAFMLREPRYKYVHYVAYPPQLFDLEQDPEELVDVAAKPEYAGVIARMRERLESMLNPQEVDARAKRRQSELLARYGGREAALARGDLGFTPAPGNRAQLD